MANHTETYLMDIIFRTNMLIDHGNTASFEDIHNNAQEKSIVTWLSDKGADMSILLSAEMAEERNAIEEAISTASIARQGSESRKLGVENNGLCLLIGLALEAIAINA